MIFPYNLTITLAPQRLPYFQVAHKILHSWMRAAFEPRTCRECLEAIIHTWALPEGLFDPSQVERGGMVATEALLFAAFSQDDVWHWQCRSRASGELAAAIGRDEVGAVAALLHAGMVCDDVALFRQEWETVLDTAALDVLCAPPNVPAPFGTWPGVAQPGVYRREHASFIIRSATTSIVTDPQIFAGYWTTNKGRYPADTALGVIDGICITHTHGDHWHLPSVLRYVTDEETLVVVPRIEQANLLADEVLETSVRLAGLPCQAAPWWSRCQIGDIEVVTLPFYGEQPTAASPHTYPGLRNWGNCYRFNCPEFSVMILVDSGVDPLGDCVDAIAASVNEDGPVDLLLSCCFDFPEVINAGLPHYALALPFEAVRQIYHERVAGAPAASMTLGVQGLVRACDAARARYFLPYAHGFQGLWREPRREATVVTALARALQEAGVPTHVLRWAPGDMVTWRGRTLEVVRH